jgi:hypothetical protein
LLLNNNSICNSKKKIPKTQILLKDTGILFGIVKETDPDNATTWLILEKIILDEIN